MDCTLWWGLDAPVLQEQARVFGLGVFKHVASRAIFQNFPLVQENDFLSQAQNLRGRMGGKNQGAARGPGVFQQGVLNGIGAADIRGGGRFV